MVQITNLVNEKIKMNLLRQLTGNQIRNIPLITFQVELSLAKLILEKHRTDIKFFKFTTSDDNKKRN